jgi:hypothetical protein
MTGTKSTKFNLWNALSSVDKKIGNTTEAAIIEVLDAVLYKKGAEAAFNTVMLSNNVASTYKSTRGNYASNLTQVTRDLLSIVQTAKTAINVAMPKTSMLVMQAMALPNIAGIPINSPKVETNKDVEVSESMVIVQSSATKKYWTDNAVPRLKEWVVTGYLTPTTPLDNGLVIKPSLQWQIHYLTVCADSRRPVMFKTNRGEFVKVQITNLHTVEEASYNNGIEVSISLKEYNPYFVDSGVGESEIAVLVGA